MNLLELLHNKPDVILLDSTENLVRAHLEHYEKHSPEKLRYRLSKLYHAMVKSIEANECDEIVTFMKTVSDERYESGYEIYEVLTAINLLEETMWKEVSKYVDKNMQIAALKQVTCILSKAKESLADEYAILGTSHIHV
jgi:hypothetical protein